MARVKPAARMVGHQATLHKRPNYKAHPPVDHQFRHDEQWKREQEPGMHVHVEKKRHLDAIAPRVSFGDRESQQRKPRNDCQCDHTTPHQVRRIAAKMRTPEKLKERSAEDQREIREFWRERFCGFSDDFRIFHARPIVPVLIPTGQRQSNMTSAAR